MSNRRNNGNVIGRLASDPKVFENRDGSKKVLFTVFADRNYENSGERLSDAIGVEAFVRKDVDYSKTPYARIHKSDLVALGTSLRVDNYTKNGATVYETKVIVEDLTFLESRSVTQARLEDRVAAAEAQNTAMAQQAQVAPVAQAVQTIPVAPEQELPFG